MYHVPDDDDDNDCLFTTSYVIYDDFHAAIVH